MFPFQRIFVSAPAALGYFPPRVHPQMSPEGRGQRAAGPSFSRAHNSETGTKTKGGGAGPGPGGKSNLAGQIIPVYGFGILLYILYILFKVTNVLPLQKKKKRNIKEV